VCQLIGRHGAQWASIWVLIGLHWAPLHRLLHRMASLGGVLHGWARAWDKVVGRLVSFA